jgi:hypothetical protein
MFLTIWQFLKSEGLVLEVDKTVTSKDFEPFFEYKPVAETQYGKARMQNNEAISFHSDLKPIKIQEIPLLQHDEAGAIKDFRNYIDYCFEYNESNELICSQFINKQIYGNSELDVFIKKNFKTNEQINFTRALIPAYLALVLSLGIALWQKFSDDNSDIIQIQNQIQELKTTIENKESPDLSQIENELQIIIDNNSSSEEISEKLSEILKEIKKHDNTSE